ncbi:MAG: GntR family transcriptional regulator, partial [Hyphomicrobiales bacterium]
MIEQRGNLYIVRQSSKLPPSNQAASIEMQPTMQPIDLTISPQTVQSQVVSKLRDAILSGHFQPGERLVESALCEMANVSRSSIREALRRLEAEKLIVIVPNKGPSVANITWEEAEDIYQVRALLEGGAAYL